MSPYLSSVPTIIAVINSVIAVYATQFKPEERRIKITLLVVAVALGIVAAGSTILSQHYALQQQEVERKDRAEKRDKIGAFIKRSSILLSELQNNSNSDDEMIKKTSEWNGEVTSFLNSISPAYVATYENMAGLPPVTPNGPISQTKSNLWSGVYFRSARLNEIMAKF
jgi:hypothetical protein